MAGSIEALLSVDAAALSLDDLLDHLVLVAGVGGAGVGAHAAVSGRGGRDEGGWQVHRRPDGTTEWISPTGRIHEKPPDDWPDGAADDADPSPP